MPTPILFEIVPTANAWRIRRRGVIEPLAELKVKQVAIDLACDLARREPPSRVVLLARDGAIQGEWKYGDTDGSPRAD